MQLLLKKPTLDTVSLTNYYAISNLPFVYHIEKTMAKNHAQYLKVSDFLDYCQVGYCLVCGIEPTLVTLANDLSI